MQEGMDMAEIIKEDKQAGFRCGVNDTGELYMADTRFHSCCYTLEDTPENRERLLADFDYSVKQRVRMQEPPKVMKNGEWTGLEYKFQVNAAHVNAIYDNLDSLLKRCGRQRDRSGIEVSSFLAGVDAVFSVIAANSPQVQNWCHNQAAYRRYFDGND